MKKYAFQPPVVQIRQGETVTPVVTSADVPHGFEAPDFGVREPAQPKQPAAVIPFTATRKGEFPMQFGVICGPGHDSMVGKIVVQ